jgi:AraC-like DNA-binding protein
MRFIDLSIELNTHHHDKFMALVTLSPFLDFALCNDTPYLLESITKEILELGIELYKTDFATFPKLQATDNVTTRIPLILKAKRPNSRGANSNYLFNCLKSKFPTAMIIEGDPEILPDLILRNSEKINTWIGLSKNEIVRQVSKLVYENIHNPNLSLTFISTKLNVSRQSLQKIFYKAGLKDGIWEYILRMRMLEAARVIQETNLSFKEISALYGYSEYDTFSKRFKQVFGFPPKEYPRN